MVPHRSHKYHWTEIHAFASKRAKTLTKTLKIWLQPLPILCCCVQISKNSKVQSNELESKRTKTRQKEKDV
uniref:Uncharacterized protein n=1 Tax=Meloidogyne enterolobii TaxID=390850 RepID=A0A6V7UVD2_MELEN|nr:unnamed protein product [Meloidogyne enterolobii]